MVELLFPRLAGVGAQKPLNGSIDACAITFSPKVAVSFSLNSFHSSPVPATVTGPS